MTTAEMDRRIDARIDERLRGTFADLVLAIGTINDSNAAIERALEANAKALKALGRTQQVLHEAVLRLQAGRS